MATVWYRLGLQLGVRAYDLDVIEKNYPRDTDMCKVKMFSKWLRSDTNPNYEKLIKALAAVGNRSLAESVCDRQGKHIHQIIQAAIHVVVINVKDLLVTADCTLLFHLQAFHDQFWMLWKMLSHAKALVS